MMIEGRGEVGLRILAFGCHPDDIEFMMSGTLFLLKQAGAEIHYMNPANGSLGTAEYDTETIIKMRREEGKKAASYLGARFHESIVNDLELIYSFDLLKKATAVVREVAPDIMLLLSLEDYMVDHMHAATLGYSAAFARGMTNLMTDPPRTPISNDIVVYHAMPYGLYDMMNRYHEPDFFIDVETVMDKKEEMLAVHKSQKNWLDQSQGMNAYVDAMKDISRELGGKSNTFRYAEGWRKHSHFGFCSKNARPLEDALLDYLHINLHKGG